MIDFAKDIKINKGELHKEWLKQSGLYMFYSEEWASAVKKRDHLKQEIEAKNAELLTGIIKRAIDSGEKKPTEKAIEAEIALDIGMQERQTKLIDLNEEVNLLSSGLKALEHKKKALENLVTLYLAGYYSSPKEPEQIDLRKGVIGETQGNIRKGIQRRKS